MSPPANRFAAPTIEPNSSSRVAMRSKIRFQSEPRLDATRQLTAATRQLTCATRSSASGTQGEAFVPCGCDLVASVEILLPAANIGHERAFLARDVVAHVPALR